MKSHMDSFQGGLSPERSENLETVLRVMAPEDNQTGGGAASAIAGALAAGLIGMVARLSTGNRGTEPDEFYEAIDGKAQKLSHSLFEGATRDAQAFARVMTAFKLPQSTDLEKAQRSRTIQEAYIGATNVPVENAQACKEALQLYIALVHHCNPNAKSDLENARFLAQACLAGCIENIGSNLKSIKDVESVSEIRIVLDELKKFADMMALRECIK